MTPETPSRYWLYLQECLRSGDFGSVRVSQIAIDANAGETPEQIAVIYPHISLPQIHAAIAYYHANRAEVDAEIEATDAYVEASMKTNVPRVTLATLEERRRAMQQAGA